MQAPTQAKKLTVLRMDRRKYGHVTTKIFYPWCSAVRFGALESSAKNNPTLIKNLIDWKTGERRIQTWNVTAFLTPLG